MKPKLALRLAVSIALLAYILYIVDVEVMVEQFRGIDRSAYGVAILMGVAGIGISAKRWQIILHSYEEHNGYWEVFSIYYLGAYSNLFLPGNIGGDAVKAYSMSSRTNDCVHAYSSVIIERLVGLVGLLLVGICAVVLVPAELPRRAVFVFLVLSAVVFVFLGFLFSDVDFNPLVPSILPDRLPTEIGRVRRSIREFRNEYRVLALTLVYSLFFQLTAVLVYYATSIAIGVNVSILVLLVVIPIIQLLLIIPASIHGYGVRETLFVVFFTEIGLTVNEAVVYSLLVGFAVLIAASFGALFTLPSPRQFLDRGESRDR